MDTPEVRPNEGHAAWCDPAEHDRASGLGLGLGELGCSSAPITSGAVVGWISANGPEANSGDCVVVDWQPAKGWDCLAIGEAVDLQGFLTATLARYRPQTTPVSGSADHRPGRQMAAHHWTHLDGWESSASIREVTSQDLSRADLSDGLRDLCEEIEAEDGEASGPVGALLTRRVDGGKPHLVMLAGQTALEERITLHNVMWLLTCGEPRPHVNDHVTVPGQGTFAVVAVHCRSSVRPDMQQDTEALVARLPKVPA